MMEQHQGLIAMKLAAFIHLLTTLTQFDCLLALVAQTEHSNSMGLRHNV
jgi:hypothetical protein